MLAILSDASVTGNLRIRRPPRGVFFPAPSLASYTSQRTAGHKKQSASGLAPAGAAIAPRLLLRPLSCPTRHLNSRLSVLLRYGTVPSAKKSLPVSFIVSPTSPPS